MLLWNFSKVWILVGVLMGMVLLVCGLDLIVCDVKVVVVIVDID